MDSVEIFISYDHADEKLLEKLLKHLASLKRQGLVNIWYDREIGPGAKRLQEIDQHLKSAQIVLLLISPDFIASDYCYSLEMLQAMERHARNEARVIPIILRPVHWQGTPFEKLSMLPKDAKPVTTHENQDEALLDVVQSVLKVAREQFLSGNPEKVAPPTSSQSVPTQPAFIYGPSRVGNRGIASFLLHEREHVLHYTRYDKLTHQIIVLTYNQQELVRDKIPTLPRLKTLERRHSFQIEGVDGLFTFKMLGVVGIMSAQLEIGGVKIFSI